MVVVGEYAMILLTLQGESKNIKGKVEEGVDFKKEKRM